MTRRNKCCLYEEFQQNQMKLNFETFQRVFGEALNIDKENETVPRNLNNN